ncbi:hypothetical protein J4206_04185 [Candidatus Woesearchaeota archaeon]|nr:hypothetical protein [Candidatus Woesearchaeota archaeon]
MATMDKTEKITYIILVILAVAALGFTIYSAFFAGSGSAVNSQAGAVYVGSSAYNKAIAAENPADKCAVPEGYDEQSWKEHMSHHPDRYKGCL